MEVLRVLMAGDVVGEPGLVALEKDLPRLLQENKIDFAVVNGENVAGGFGMTEAALRRIIAAGADVVTSGNHVWEKREFWNVLDTEPRMLRPANYPEGVGNGSAENGTQKTPGRGFVRLEKTASDGTPVSWLVINLQGREQMTPIDCPFRCFDSIVASVDTPFVLVDFHAETTREKESLAYYLDGRASFVAGTHTHVQTADERILPNGTGYITDLGMTGVKASVIGMDPKICIERVRRQILYRMEVAGEEAVHSEASADAEVQGIIAEIDRSTGKTVAVRRV